MTYNSYQQQGIDELVEFVYENGLEGEFEQYSPYHWKIQERINVWPTTRKFSLYSGSSRVYDNVEELKEFISFKK